MRKKTPRRSPQTLAVALDWGEAHCVIPDGDFKGEPFLLSDEQFAFLAHHYLVRADAQPPGPNISAADAFVYRRSQLVRGQKWGKSPLIAFTVCIEAVGPARFAGFALAGEVYDCAKHGCDCGWVYEYHEGEPKGMPWPTPLIQITATSEDQTDNTYDALRPMIDEGPLHDLIPKTGEEFIRLPNGGRIDVVTSKANSRLGQRVTFAPQDETGLWTAGNGGHKLATTQRRGLAGMGGRSIETTNAWNPAEDSQAQRTFESKATDIYRDFRQPPANLSFKNKRERRRILAYNYAGVPWVSLDSIEAEAVELMELDPAEAERFFGNRIVAGSGAWMNIAKWEAKADLLVVDEGEPIVLGFDGSEVDDWTAIRAETLDGYQFTPTLRNGRKTIWNPREYPGQRVPRAEVFAAFLELFERYDVVRAYLDPPMWETMCDRLEGRFGSRVVQWATFRPGQMHAALERFRTDVLSDPDFVHDGDQQATAHIRNAVEAARPGNRYLIFKASETQKIDVAMASVLAHEAACDAIAAGAADEETSENFIYM